LNATIAYFRSVFTSKIGNEDAVIAAKPIFPLYTSAHGVSGAAESKKAGSKLKICATKNNCH